MTLMEEAYASGQFAKRVNMMRTSPFYNVRVLIEGRQVDVTPMLDAFWYAGFDGEAISNALDATAN